ncbi:MAG: regulatory protein RecX [Candidatus Zipacnadales bacterium]
MPCTEHTITKVKMLKRPRGYCAVYIDGKLTLKASRAAVEAAGLQLGKKLDDSGLKQALEAAQQADAFNQALALLASRDRTQAELQRRLSAQQFPQSIVATVLDRLRDKGLIDDRRYARDYVRVRTQSERRGLGPCALRSKLSQLGITSSVIDEVLTEELPEEAEIALAEAIARKHLRRLGRYEGQDVRARLYTFIARRGFDHEVTMRTLDSVLGEDYE